MSYRSERFNDRMRSLEELSESITDPSKAKVFSDGGDGAERMYALLDLVPEDDERDERERLRDMSTQYDIAIILLYVGQLGYLVPTLRLIVRNINQRENSICEMK